MIDITGVYNENAVTNFCTVVLLLYISLMLFLQTLPSYVFLIFFWLYVRSSNVVSSKADASWVCQALEPYCKPQLASTIGQPWLKGGP
jgi:hypothetical protein